MEPGVIRCFGCFNIIHPHPGDPARIDQVLTCVYVACTHGSPLLIHSHLEAFSAASVVVLMAFLCRAPVMPSRLYALRERLCCEASTAHLYWHTRARHPRLRHSYTKSVDLAHFLLFAPSICSSQGIVSSSRTTCLTTRIHNGKNREQNLTMLARKAVNHQFRHDRL